MLNEKLEKQQKETTKIISDKLIKKREIGKLREKTNNLKISFSLLNTFSKTERPFDGMKSYLKNTESASNIYVI